MAKHTHTTTTGGCCDCGDPEAIDSKFFCARHGTFHGSNKIKTSEHKALLSIFSFMGNFILQRSDAFDHIRPVSIVEKQELILHNDDVHSFQEVLDALKAIGVDDPKYVATKAHEIGSFPIDHSMPAVAFKTLRSEHKLFVSLRESSDRYEHSLFDILLKYLISKSASFRRDIAASLIKSISCLKTSTHDSSKDDTPSSLKKLRVKDMKARLDKLKVDYSKCVEKSDLLSLLSSSLLSETKSNGTNPDIKRMVEFVKTKIIKNDDVEPSFRRRIYRLVTCRLNGMPSEMSRSRVLQDLLHTCRAYRPQDEAILLGFVPSSMGSDVFAMERGSINQKDTLSIFLELGSRIANKKSEESLLQLLVILFGDSEFRKVSCDRMLRVHGRLALDYCRGVGTKEHSMFQCNVQIFTTPSLVRSHLTKDPKSVLTALWSLAGIFYRSHNKPKLVTHKVYDAYMATKNHVWHEKHVLNLDSKSMRSFRFSYILHDLIYMLRCEGAAISTVQSIIEDPNFSDLFVNMILRPIQGINSFQRKFGDHVVRDNMDWRVSFQIDLQIMDMIQILFKKLPSNHHSVQALLGFLTRSVETWSKEQEHNSQQNGAHILNNEMVRLERSFGGICSTCFRENVNFEDLRILVPCMHILGCSACYKRSGDYKKRKKRVWVRCPECKAGRCIGSTKTIKRKSDGIEAPSTLTHMHSASSEFQFVSLLIPRSGLYGVSHTYHLPLLRTRAALAMSLARVVKSKTELLPMSTITKTASLSCVEWSLRCLAMSEMIKCGMFRRNGDAVLNMNFNYTRFPLTHDLRDLDVRSVQLGVMRLGANHVIGLMYKHFGVLKLAGYSAVVRTDSTTSTTQEMDDPRLEDDFLIPMSQACIGLICTLATELPWKEDSNHTRIRREIIHALVASERGVCTRSVLENCVGERRRKSTGDDTKHNLERVLSEITQKETTSSNTTVYRLKDEHLEEYDPFFFNLSRESHQHAHQYVRDRKKGILSHRPPGLIHALDSFRDVRSEILTSPVVLLIIKNALKTYITSSDGESIALAATHWLSLTSCFLERECENRECATRFYISFCGTKAKQTSTLDFFERAKRHADKVGDLEVAENIGCALRNLHRLEERWTGGLFQMRFDVDLIGEKSKENQNQFKSAQERAMAAIAAQQSKFAEMMDMSSSSEDEDEDDDDEEEEDDDDDDDDDGDEKETADEEDTITTKEEDEEEEVCVMCRSSSASEGDSCVGYVAFVQHLDKTPYVSFCGHLLHMSCRDKYQASLIQQRMQDPFALLKLVDVEKGEFTCPLCKTLSNTVVPYTSSSSPHMYMTVIEENRKKTCASLDAMKAWLNGVGGKNEICVERITENLDIEKGSAYDLNCMMKFIADDEEEDQDAAYTSCNPEELVHQSCRTLAKCFDFVPPHKRSQRGIRSLWNVLVRSIRKLRYPFTLTSLLPTRSTKYSDRSHKNICQLLTEGMCERKVYSRRVLLTEDPLALLIEGLVVLPPGLIPDFVWAMHYVAARAICVRHNGSAGKDWPYGLDSKTGNVVLDVPIVKEKYEAFKRRVEHLVRVCGIPIVYKLTMKFEDANDVRHGPKYVMKWLTSMNRKNLGLECPFLFRKESLCRSALPETFDALIIDTMKVKCGESTIEDPMVCLLCADVLCSRSCDICCVDGVGPVTRHVRSKHKGCGVVMRVSTSEILLFRGDFCASYPSLYVDQYGEEDRGLRRGKPLTLSPERFEALDKLYRRRGIAQEVSRRRLHADRVYRNNVF